MQKNPFFIFLFLLLVVIAVLEFIGLQRFWLFIFWWFDLLLHFLGGVWVSGMALWLFFLSGYVHGVARNSTNILLVAVISFLVIGIAWEIFEFLVGAIFAEEVEYFFDTATDMLIGLFGGLLVSYFFLRRYGQKQI